MSRLLTHLLPCVGLAVLALPAPAAEPARDLRFRGPVESGHLTSPPRSETSGLAASRRNADLLWLHDDSGGKPFLYAVGPDGTKRGKLQIGGSATNDDWEDVAAAEFDGKAWLVIGDVGDNDAKRRNLRLYVVEEPASAGLALAGQLAARPTATLRLRYEDGPRDCESLAIAADERAVYLLTKRDRPPRLYRAPLPQPLHDGEITARLVTTVPHLPQPTAAQALLPGRLGQHRAQPTGMDFAADGSAAVVLTYGDLLLFPRQKGESWGQALARPPRVLPGHNLPQAEAVGFTPEGRHVFVASENNRTLLRYDRP